jgi:hypothetical protein
VASSRGLAANGPQEQSLRRWRFGGVSTTVTAFPKSSDQGRFVQSRDYPRVRAAEVLAVARLSRTWNCDEIGPVDFHVILAPLRENVSKKDVYDYNRYASESIVFQRN